MQLFLFLFTHCQTLTSVTLVLFQCKSRVAPSVCMKVWYSWFDPDKTVVMLAGRRQHFLGFDKDCDQTSDWEQTCISICCQGNLQSQGWVWLRRVCCWSPGQDSLAMFSGSCTPAFFPTAVCCCGTSPSPSAPCKNSLDQLLPLWHKPCPTLRQSSLLNSVFLCAQEAGCALQNKGTFSGYCNTSQHRCTNSHSIYLVILVTPQRLQKV